MLLNLKKIFSEKNNISDNEIDPKLAFSALLIEAGMTDGNLDNNEKNTIDKLLSNFFELSPNETSKLIKEAIEVQGNSSQIIHLTRSIKENFSENQRINMVQMMWEVILSDGEEHMYEQNLMRRIAGLLYISDKSSGIARKTALKEISSK
ncbi:MAG: hypothetical protein CFH01_00981 [Alphaproteobacteria bacterium MarineAlpha2_Bin1]|nr:MAG: hypothetical protein CFH01_00981 [Alphaproteobacteria bacterium MarineAlpha2_Bin1]|tara:strand:- start:620 stop:1069 length:450 start_codon:yes stop_codon:yes gene_type:complete